MRVAVLLLVPTLAAAEPRWSFGWRSTGGTQLGPPPPWLLNGGQWRLRASRHLSFAIDADGGRGDAHEAHDLLMTETARSLIKVGVSAAVHAWRDDRWDLRGFVGGGGAAELVHERMLGLAWEVERVELRPFGFAGAGLERHHTLSNGRRVGIGLDVRSVWLVGDGPDSAAPALDRFGLQLALELNAYL